MKNLFDYAEPKRLVAFVITTAGILFLAFGNVLFKNIGMYITMICFIVFFVPMILENDRLMNYVWRPEESEKPEVRHNIIFLAILLYILTFMLVLRVVPRQ